MNSTSQNNLQWLSRTIAIILIMIGPALLGNYADERLETQFLMPTGLVVGVALAMFLLLLLAKQFTPPARGLPLPFEDEEEDEEDS